MEPAVFFAIIVIIIIDNISKLTYNNTNKYNNIFISIFADRNGGLIMVLDTLIPISQFNKGQAAKIFDELTTKKEMVVLKNNQPSAVLLSPDEYKRLMEIEEDYNLLLEANTRLLSNQKLHSEDEVMKKFNITQEELDEMEDVEIE